MKMNKNEIGKLVLIRLRAGGVYTGKIVEVTNSTVNLEMASGMEVHIMQGQIASIQFMEVK